MCSRGARIQPTRRPPQQSLDALPMVNASVANAANGTGIDASDRQVDCRVSSTMAIVRVARSAAA